MQITITSKERNTIMTTINTAVELVHNTTNKDRLTEEEVIKNLKKAFSCEVESTDTATTISVEEDYVITSFKTIGMVYQRANNIVTKVKETMFSVAEELEAAKEELSNLKNFS